MQKILNGVAQFHRERHHTITSLFACLAKEGQSPGALFISCADSRVLPDLITKSDPGDLFTVRNIGNLVPPYDATTTENADISVAAALDYSLDVLKLENIIVCGHSDCGAMKAKLNGTDHLPRDLSAWLEHANATTASEKSKMALDDTLPPHDHLAQRNVLQQLDNLASYPKVRQAVQEGRVQLHGWFFDIGRAEVQMFDPKRGRFAPAQTTPLVEPSVIASIPIDPERTQSGVPTG